MRTSHAMAPGRGSALVFVLITIGVCFLILTGVLLWSSSSGQLSVRHTEHSSTQAAAEAAAEKIVAQIANGFRDGGRPLVDASLANYATYVPNATEHAAWNNYDFVDNAGTPGRAYVGIATNWHAGPVNWKGGNLQGESATYRVVATARSGNVSALSAAVLQDLEIAAIPITSFFMFAHPDLELSPGSGQWTNDGPVHGNANLYFSPSVGVTFADQVTAAGQILHERAPSDPEPEGGGTITYLATHESESALLRLPLSGIPGDPDSLWSFCSTRADLRITILSDTNFEAFNRLGDPVPTTLLGSVLRPDPDDGGSSFVDLRECDLPSERVVATVFDVGAFQALGPGFWAYMVGSIPATSVYLQDERASTSTRRFLAVKLVNASTLARPFTFATRQPLYVQGPFNSPDSAGGTIQPAALIADAVTVLSSAWLDANGHQPLNSPYRLAVNTTNHAAIITGNVPTGPGAYSGGFENLPRLLENWSARTLQLNGSLVLLFHSQIATREWDPDAGVYYPPQRVFRFAPTVCAGAPIAGELKAELLARSAWRTVTPGATE